ncbi:GIY-YIG nuclease family protein [Gloeothece verrucosa]|uniref:GIY-YIG domain-containing protein n=1 Tax=Gloeothece verrucosa (strain PCC 7822) TaxID=497965 RepID=E0UAG9_GLOV7|nr:hypothetical protein Cyan7822_0674 [Gloeothece verrucosa PCC 7822]
MTCYLLHFLPTPIGSEKHSAQHYLGYTSKSIKKRLNQHLNGQGAKITAAAIKQGKTLKLVRTWPKGTRALERQLKRHKRHAKFCPICSIKKVKL